MRSLRCFATCLLIVFSLSAPGVAQEAEEHGHSHSGSEEGLGRAHMEISCSPAVAAKFDRAFALLHNFWYGRALEGFQQVSNVDPECAIAYWGAAMTYNHPFWDAPSSADETAAWGLVQKGLAAKKMSPREKLYLNAVAALFKDAGAGPKAARDEGYRDAMAAVYASFPDDETNLFYGLAILGEIKEGTKGFERQAQAAKLFEEVYARSPDHPGVLHYLIHVYDDPAHAEEGLEAARRYAKTAAAVPHALHMPSHIFTRLGYWDESAATNENAWRTSESDVKRAGESGDSRDFHSLNYLEYAYLQLGRFRDARGTLDIIAAQYDALPEKKTSADTPELQAPRKPRMMRANRFGNLRAHAHHGIERGHRLLKNHGDVAPAHADSFAFGEREQIHARPGSAVRAREPRFAAHARARRQQSHQRQREHRFPAARFADKSERFARFERKRNVVHRTNPSRRRRNLDGEPAQLDQWSHRYIIRRIVLWRGAERSAELASGNPIMPPSE